MTTPKLTPMMEDYFKKKEKYPDCLLFYRLGDFYELFFEDAQAASDVLGIVLTTKGKIGDQTIPMCGVPFHAYENYLVRLIKAGYKVAICEQMETAEAAKKRGPKEVVSRDVIRIVTAGTLTEDALLDAKKNNYLVAVAAGINSFGIAWTDMSTGDFHTQTAPAEEVYSVLVRLDAAEILIADNLLELHPHLLRQVNDRCTQWPAEYFSYIENKETLESFFKLDDLMTLGDFARCEVAAAGALLKYILHTQKGARPALSRPQKMKENSFMEIDAATRHSLELTASLGNNKNETSVFKTLDMTKTGLGARLLMSQLSTPLMNMQEINQRLDKVDFFFQNPLLREKVQAVLKEIPDIERSVSRILLGNGSPREMLNIAKGLEKIPDLRNLISGEMIPDALRQDLYLLGEHSELVSELISAIREDAKGLMRDGGFIQMGYSPDLDELLFVREEAKKIMADLQHKYSTETGINNLKVTFNNLLGYFIEVPTRYAEPLLTDKSKGFKHRQTMVNVVRFTTEELSDWANKILNAEEKSKAMELEIFEQLREKIRLRNEEIVLACRGIARIDVASSLAYGAEINHWTRPVLTMDTVFEIRGGRHLVVEKALKKEKKSFIPNDCVMDDEQGRLWILTGPNMAGKSTFLRQNAVIAVLAQMGSFVPAEYAKIGLVDKLYSRVGASDDLARGCSTFMVEMIEVAAILNGATERSLVILDEVGRGTATFDGLSIAWAVVEYLHDFNKCRGLFATHYHELTALINRLDKISLHTMRVKEWQGDIVFLHEVCTGATDRSYGIHVGKLAGLPEIVLGRAEQILEQLEEKKQNQKPLFDDLPLFSQAIKTTSIQKDSPVVTAVQKLDVDTLSPREALDYLYHLKQLAEA